MVVSVFLVVFLLHLKLKYRTLFSSPIAIGPSSNDKVKAHAASTVHCESVIAMKSFEEVHSGMQPSIDTSFSRDRQWLFRTNCIQLDAIIDCILLCGKQNIPLQGHMQGRRQRGFGWFGRTPLFNSRILKV